jgi:hypothetical protein
MSGKAGTNTQCCVTTGQSVAEFTSIQRNPWRAGSETAVPELSRPVVGELELGSGELAFKGSLTSRSVVARVVRFANAAVG